MAQNLHDNWKIDNILTEKWQLQPPPPYPFPPIQTLSTVSVQQNAVT